MGTWFYVFLSFLPYIVIISIIVLIVKNRKKARQKAELEAQRKAALEQEEKRKRAEEQEAERKRKQEEAKRKKALQQAEEEKEKIETWKKDIQENLLQYANNYHLQVADTALTFEQRNLDDSNTRMIVSYYNGIKICLVFQPEDDSLILIIIIDKVICCGTNEQAQNINQMPQIFNYALKEAGLEKEIGAFELPSSQQSIVSQVAYSFSKLMLIEEKEYKKMSQRPDSIVEFTIEPILYKAVKLFQTPFFLSCAKKAQSIGKLGNEITKCLNQCETPLETAFQFKSQVFELGIKFSGKPEPGTNWLGACELELHIHEKSLFGIFGPINFFNSKAKEEFDQIVEDYNAKFAGFKAFNSNDGIWLGMRIDNVNMADSNSFAAITALYQTFLEQSESIREFFKEKD